MARNTTKNSSKIKEHSFVKNKKKTSHIKNKTFSVGDKTVKEHAKSTREEHKGIKSLKDMEKKILEKFEEHKPEPVMISPNIVSEEKKEAPVVQNIVKEKKNLSETADYKTRVEAILFAVGKYLEDEMIAQLCEIDKRNVKKALEELKNEYESRDTALMIVQEGNSWKINVREKYLSLVRKIVADTELSKSIMETLAVIAWKTPIYQNEIVRIRGNKCYDHIEELVNAGFVTKDKKGRSYILKTTEKFYNYFDIDQKNLKNIMDEAKLPAEQTTLAEVEKRDEQVQTYSREKLLQALDTIETKKIIQTEEDRNSQRAFLERIHAKIEDSAKRTDGIISEIPHPMHQQEQAPALAEDVPPEISGDAVIEKDDEDIVIDTGVESGSNHFQKPTEHPQKIKQLTKKQLEKKFREELQRVKEKGDQKK